MLPFIAHYAILFHHIAPLLQHAFGGVYLVFPRINRWWHLIELCELFFLPQCLPKRRFKIYRQTFTLVSSKSSAKKNIQTSITGQSTIYLFSPNYENQVIPVFSKVDGWICSIFVFHILTHDNNVSIMLPYLNDY